MDKLDWLENENGSIDLPVCSSAYSMNPGPLLLCTQSRPSSNQSTKKKVLIKVF